MKQKFKVWDKKNLKFDDSNDIYVDMDGDIYLIEERNFAMMSHMHREEVSDRYELIWFTGLTDKNGVEIYEGDILKCKSFTGNVHFTNGSYFADHVSAPGYYQDLMRVVDERQMGPCEVIGNIYTHPHLLGSEKE